MKSNWSQYSQLIKAAIVTLSIHYVLMIAAIFWIIKYDTLYNNIITSAAFIGVFQYYWIAPIIILLGFKGKSKLVAGIFIGSVLTVLVNFILLLIVVIRSL